MTEMRCWWCGVEPNDIHDIVTADDTIVRRIPEWPPGDRPEQLTAAGHTALRRILETP